MHLDSVESVKLAVEEMHRVAKPGAVCYAYFGTGKGVVKKYIDEPLREAYKNDKEFANFIDNLNIEKLRGEFRKVLSKSFSEDELITPDLVEKLLSLITLDSITFFQNLLQVPSQLGYELDENFIISMLEEIDAKDISRCPDTKFYFKRKDWRRFLTPFHISREDSDFSRIMFGKGHTKFAWKK